MGNTDLGPYHDMLAGFQQRRRELLAESDRNHAPGLHLKFLRQQAHFTTPASSYDMALKAVEKGSSAAARILEKFHISLAELSETLEVPVSALEAELGAEPHSPFVMIDSEDAQALREDVILRGRENAIRIFREASWGPTLRFYRPSGLRLDFCLDDLITVLTQAGNDLPPEAYPIDGIVWPKAEQPEEIAFVCELLEAIEERVGLEKNRIKLEFLVESGWAVAQLPLLVKACTPRLAGIIFGIADYSADIGLPTIHNNHPVCDWARAAIVNMAGAAGVPAIDNMTVDYPVADSRLSEGENHLFIKKRIKHVFDDARHGQQLGMDGKWVGHPLQLFAVRLAYRMALPEEEIRAETEKILHYARAVAEEKGATIIEGVMSDRATDRHARNKLRKAIALGLLDPQKGVELGLISRQEYLEIS
jgi:malyl-CoA/(S)-citramalyl-CoA lyase